MTIGIEELQRKLSNLSRDMLPTIEKAMTDAVQNVERKAKENCTPGSSPYYRAPHITGTMLRSIASKIDVKGTEIKGIIHAGGTKANYAEEVHEGTSRMPPRPYILDAITEKENETLEFLSDAIENNLRKHIT